MSQWKDRKENDKILSSEIVLGAFKLQVYRLVDCGDTWFANCYGIFTNLRLASKGPDEAKCQALTVLQTELKKAIAETMSVSN